MKSYRLRDGDTLVFSVDHRAWETITFHASDFKEIKAATAEELDKVINQSAPLEAHVDDNGELVIATKAKGSQISLEIDLASSSAAAALGLTAGRFEARGEGLAPARLISRTQEPFGLPQGAQMTIVLNGQPRKVTFDKGITVGKATADEVAGAINTSRTKVAHATRDGRVVLTSTTVGVDSSLEVQPGPGDGITPDAALSLGFVGAAAASQPSTWTPARLACSGRPVGLYISNLTAGPIELYLGTGIVVLAARATIPLASSEAASGSLQRLVELGVVRLTSQISD